MFHLTQRVLWLGRPAQIIAKTYGPVRKYDLTTEHGGHRQDVPEEQLAPVDNVVPLAPGRQSEGG